MDMGAGLSARTRANAVTRRVVYRYGRDNMVRVVMPPLWYRGNGRVLLYVYLIKTTLMYPWSRTDVLVWCDRDGIGCDMVL